MNVLLARITPVVTSVACHLVLAFWLAELPRQRLPTATPSLQMMHVNLQTIELKAPTRSRKKPSTQVNEKTRHAKKEPPQVMSSDIELSASPLTSETAHYKNLSTPSTAPIQRPGPWLNTDKPPMTFAKRTQESSFGRAIAAAARPDCLKRTIEANQAAGNNGESSVSGLLALPSLLISAANGSCN